MNQYELMEKYNRPRCQMFRDFIDREIEAVPNVNKMFTNNSINFCFNTPSCLGALKLEVMFYSNTWRVRVIVKQKYTLHTGVVLTEGNKLFKGTKDIEQWIRSLLCNVETEKESSVSELISSIKREIYQAMAYIDGDTKYNPDKYLSQFWGAEVSEDNLLEWFKIYHSIKFKIDSEHHTSSVYKMFDNMILSGIAKHAFKCISSLKKGTSELDSIIEAESNPICYAHVLPFYGGKCHNLHGHNGVLAMSLMMNSSCLTHRPMLVSYGFLKGFLKQIDNELDHKTHIHLGACNIVSYREGEIEYDTCTTKISFKSDESCVLIPSIGEQVGEMTSEKILSDYVIPRFYRYLLEHLITPSVDNTDMTMFELFEEIRASFTWCETDKTRCSLSIKI